MVCKYCGAQYSGNKCTACGKVIPLVKRSTNLDILMSEAAAPGKDDASRKKSAAEKTFEQGIREGYQKGLREGYDNGFRDGKKSVPAVPVPAVSGEDTGATDDGDKIAREKTAGGKTTVSVAPPRRKTRFRWIKAVAICVLILAVAAGAGIAGHHLGKEAGRTEGYDTAEQERQAGLEQGRQEGLEQGRQEGSEEAEKKYSKQIEELQEKLNEAYGEGYNAAMDEIEEQNKAKTSPAGTGNKPSQDREAEKRPAIRYSMEMKDVEDEVVKKIQRRLMEKGYKLGKNGADGYYGPNTYKAVVAFQKKNRLPITGEVDRETYDALFPEEAETDDTPEDETKEPGTTDPGEEEEKGSGTEDPEDGKAEQDSPTSRPQWFPEGLESRDRQKILAGRP